MNNTQIFQNKKPLLIFATAILVVYIGPFLILGKDVAVLIHDNLDSNVVWYKILAESGKIFGNLNGEIPNILNGVPRSTFPSEFNFIVWLYYFFEPFTAYVLNQIIMRILGFIGMFLLLKKHFFGEEEEQQNLIIIGTSLVYALLPFWPSGGLSVAGQPLVLYALRNIRNRNYHKRNWLILTLVPLYASFELSFIFFLAIMGILLLYDVIKQKKTNFYFAGSLIFMTFLFLAYNYRLLYTMFFDVDFVSHRTEMISKSLFAKPAQNILEHLNHLKIDFTTLFINGQYHAPSLHKTIILPTTIFALLLSFRFKSYIKHLLIFLLLLVSIIFLSALGRWDALQGIKENIGVLRSFQFDRFYFLFPILWYLIFAKSLLIISKSIRCIGHYAIILLIFGQIGYLFTHNIQWQGIIDSNKMSWNQFYSVELFESIDQFIDKDKSDFHIITIGFHPSIAQFNGFYTLDGYYANYPLEYKHQFRTIIKDELAKNKKMQGYFDEWGSRCYCMVNDIDGSYMVTKKSNAKIDNLQLNISAIHQIGGKYIMSAAQIKNYNANNMKYLSVFETDKSPWRIYLYEIQ